MPDLDKLRAKAKACPNRTLKESRERVWLFIAADVPAKRADWGQIRVVKRADKLKPAQNGIVVSNSDVTLILQAYKNGSHLPPTRRRAPKGRSWRNSHQS
jgi:hypothetical protein